MSFKLITISKSKHLLVFSSGKIFGIEKDVIRELEVKVQTTVEKKSLKIYRSSYIYFNYRKFSPAKLVANSFIDNPNSYLKIRRRNPNVLNNSVDNLYWSLDDKIYEDKKKMIANREAVDFESLCPLNKIIYNYIVNGKESDLYLNIFKGNMRRYLWKAFYDRGLPDKNFETFLDMGYEKLQERLIKFYHFKNNFDYSVRKYIFLTMYFVALTYNRKEKRVNLEFLPRELKNNQQFYYEMTLEDYIISV